MYVYGLIDPPSSTIYYIGVAEDIEQRAVSHFRASDVSNLAKNRWIAGLKRQGLEPIVVVLEYSEDRNVIFEAETQWIQTGIRLGWPLLNISKVRSVSYADKLTQEIGGWLLENHRDKIVDDLVSALLVETQSSIFPTSRNGEKEEIRPSGLQRTVWQWREANPNGTQADLRKEFAERGIEISRGYVHECWHQWNNQEMKGM